MSSPPVRIKCKLMDCVEVCPADCFYEGEYNLSSTRMSASIAGVAAQLQCPVHATEPDTEPGMEKAAGDQRRIRQGVAQYYHQERHPRPDAKKWEGKPNKLEYFYRNPGAGDRGGERPRLDCRPRDRPNDPTGPSSSRDHGRFNGSACWRSRINLPWWPVLVRTTVDTTGQAT